MKLSQTDKSSIVSQYLEGVRVEKIADKLNISTATIYNALTEAGIAKRGKRTAIKGSGEPRLVERAPIDLTTYTIHECPFVSCGHQQFKEFEDWEYHMDAVHDSILERVEAAVIDGINRIWLTTHALPISTNQGADCSNMKPLDYALQGIPEIMTPKCGSGKGEGQSQATDVSTQPKAAFGLALPPKSKRIVAGYMAGFYHINVQGMKEDEYAQVFALRYKWNNIRDPKYTGLLIKKRGTR